MNHLVGLRRRQNSSDPTIATNGVFHPRALREYSSPFHGQRSFQNPIPNQRSPSKMSVRTPNRGQSARLRIGPRSIATAQQSLWRWGVHEIPGGPIAKNNGFSPSFQFAFGLPPLFSCFLSLPNDHEMDPA